MKRIFKSAMLTFLAALTCLSLFSCVGRKRKYTDTYFDVFDSFATITVMDGSEDSYNKYNEIFKTEIYRWHRLLDVYNEYDGEINLCTLNVRAASEPVAVSDELFEFLDGAVSMHSLTGGYTSITLGALTSVWKEAISAKALPSEAKTEAAAEHTDISDLRLDSALKTVYFTDSELKLDAGALAKGYVADIAHDALVEAGCESFLLNIGGTLRAFGQKDGGADWFGGIQSPDKEGDMDISVSISGRALSTSGSYNRGFDLDGVRYHHIINPFTKKPENTFLSVSIICDSAFRADALSTALFSGTYEDGKALADRLDFEAVWISADGTLSATDGIELPK